LRCQIEGGHVHCAFNTCSYQQRHLGANELAFQNEKGKTSHERRAELRKAVERCFFALWNKTYLVCFEV